MTELALNRIGGSDAAAIMGLSPYGSPLTVWARIVEQIHDAPDERRLRRMEAGKRFERAIADWWASERGVEVEWFESMTHPGREWQRLTPDCRVIGEPRLVSIKRYHRIPDSFGTPGTDQVGPYETLQELFYAEALRSMGQAYESSTIVVHDLSSDELVEWSVPWDPELGAMIVEACERFWRDYVLTRRPPPVDGSDAARRYLAKRHPQDAQPIRPATPEEEMAARTLLELRAKAIGIEEAIDEAENTLRASIGDAAGIQGDWGRLTWKRSKDRETVDYQAIVEHQFATLKATPEQRAAVLSQFKKVSPGPRVFRVWPAREG